MAIGFLEKTPDYFIVDKVIAAKKIGWIQNDYEQLGLNPDFDQYYFQKLDAIVLNSTTTTESFKRIFRICQQNILY